MARNKHPEETVNLILDVALALFFEKGYDNTSIQDIIDGLGGLTKGRCTTTSSRRKTSCRLRSTATTKRCSTSFAASATTAA